MSTYSHLSNSELFQRICDLADDHRDDDELYNDTGEVDYTLTHLRMLIDELDNRVAEKLLNEDNDE